MKCRSCRQPAGWLRRRCPSCSTLWAIFVSNRGAATPRQFFHLFAASGVSPEKVRVFLESDPDGSGSIQDRIAADMTNDLFEALGRSRRQSPDEVKRLRQKGLWRSYGQRPSE